MIGVSRGEQGRKKGLVLNGVGVYEKRRRGLHQFRVGGKKIYWGEKIGFKEETGENRGLRN